MEVSKYKEDYFPAIKIKSRETGEVCYAAKISGEFRLGLSYQAYSEGYLGRFYPEDGDEGPYKVVCGRTDYEEEEWIILPRQEVPQFVSTNVLLIYYEPVPPASNSNLWEELDLASKSLRGHLDQLGRPITEVQARSMVLSLPPAVLSRIYEVPVDRPKVVSRVKELNGEEGCKAQGVWDQVREDVGGLAPSLEGRVEDAVERLGEEGEG